MESLCEPCVREGKRVDSQFYCTTCEEVYCYACSKKHTMYKISLRHIIKPIKATDITPNYQLYEQMCFSKASLSQSSREDKDMSKASGILHEYIDMSHAARSNNKGATRHQTESKSDTNATTISDQLSTKSDNRSPSTQMQVLNDQSLLKQAVQNDSNTKSYTNATQIKTTTNATGSISLNEEDTTYLHPTHTEYDASESINEIYKEYPYSYADVNTKANARVIDEALTGKRTKRNSGNNINTEDEKTDIHVYDEIEESLVDSSTENPDDIYVVELTRSPLPDDELSGYFRLRLTTSGVELLQDCKKKYVIYFWPYPYIRRFGKTCNRTFFLETGRKCGRWCGHFEFASKSYEQIKEKMDSIVANKNKGK